LTVLKPRSRGLGNIDGAFCPSIWAALTAPLIPASLHIDAPFESTGATIKIAASRKLTLAPAKAVKDALNG
jgi:hypothetical protein